jgi:hypothetical protein
MTKPKESCHGFTKGRSVASNASVHVGASIVLNVDLQEFFPTIHFGRVRGVFANGPFSFADPVAAILAQVCCVDSVLPQGAPTSPILANLVCRGLDSDLRRLTKRLGCRYSRYADDISISTKRSSLPEELLASYVGPGDKRPEVGRDLIRLIEQHGFALNNDKTRVRTAAQRLVVTGLIVNKKVNVQRRYVRDIRACLHDWNKNGYRRAGKSFLRRRAGTGPTLANHLRGKLNYLKMVKGPDDATFTKYALQFKTLRPSARAVPIVGKCAAIPAFLKHAIWIVVGRDASGSVLYNGTAFAMDGLFVTARHVFEVDDPVKWELLLASNTAVSRPVLAYREHKHFDITILKTRAKPIGSLLRSPAAPGVAEPVHTAGYPNWHTPADGLYQIAGTVAQQKTVSMVDYILIDKTINPGLSGSPVLDTRGYVHGAFAYGDNGAFVKNAAVAIHHLTEVSTAAWKPL